MDRRNAARSSPALGLAALMAGFLSSGGFLCGFACARIEPSANLRVAAEPSTNAPSSSGFPAREGSSRPFPSDAAPGAAPAAHAEEPVAAPSAALAPLAGDESIVPLVVSPFRDAMVAVPIGATEPRPVVVALHGNYDRPEWQCEVWRAVTHAFPFVLCPRGIPRPDAPPPLDRWTYGKGADVRREVEAGLVALGQRFGEHVASGPILYAGFSLGAIVGVGIVTDQPSRFPRAVLIEGGHSQWTRERALAYASAGGRVLFACGQPSCKGEVSAPRTLLSRAGAAVHVVYGDERAHTYDGKVADAITPELTWLTEGDQRWAPLAGR